MKGVVYIFKLLWLLIKGLFTGMLSLKNILPGIFVGLFMFINLGINVKNLGWTEAFKNFALNLLVAERNILINVKLAVDGTFGLMEFLSILNSLFIIFYFIKYVGLFLQFKNNDNPGFKQYISAIMFLLFLEVTVQFGLEGSISTIPLSGITALIVNIDKVLYFIN